MMNEPRSIQLDESLLNQIRELKKKDGRLIGWHINKAVEQYLKTVGRDENQKQ
jgi:anti-anti-sigma regulatory factor